MRHARVDVLVGLELLLAPPHGPSYGGPPAPAESEQLGAVIEAQSQVRLGRDVRRSRYVDHACGDDVGGRREAGQQVGVYAVIELEDGVGAPAPAFAVGAHGGDV